LAAKKITFDAHLLKEKSVFLLHNAKSFFVDLKLAPVEKFKANPFGTSSTEVLLIKGTVQRDLRGVKSGINR
jgi:hypothetical protein